MFFRYFKVFISIPSDVSGAIQKTLEQLKYNFGKGEQMILFNVFNRIARGRNNMMIM